MLESWKQIFKNQWTNSLKFFHLFYIKFWFISVKFLIRRLKNWKKIEEKPPEKHTNSLKAADNSVNSYSTENQQQKQGSSYNDDAMSLKNEVNNITLMPDPMKRLNNITDNQ